MTEAKAAPDTLPVIAARIAWHRAPGGSARKELLNVGHDRAQLEPMARKAHDAMGCEELTALTDRGYFNGEQVLACEGTGILPCVPKTVVVQTF